MIDDFERTEIRVRKSLTLRDPKVATALRFQAELPMCPVRNDPHTGSDSRSSTANPQKVSGRYLQNWLLDEQTQKIHDLLDASLAMQR